MQCSDTRGSYGEDAGMPTGAAVMRGRQRLDYIDVLRLLAMYAVYVGHLAQFAEPATTLVYLYHVPLFFLISGAMDRLAPVQGFGRYLNRKIRTILIPCLFFALLSVAVFAVSERLDFDGVLQCLQIVLEGCVINCFFASALWFLTALFVMSLLFYYIKKLHSPVAILAICLLLHLYAVVWQPSIVESWYWNLGGCCKYLLYYALGYLLFPWLNHFVTGREKKTRIVFVVAAILCTTYFALLYLGKDALHLLPVPESLSWLKSVVRSLLLIGCNVAAAYALRGVASLARAGRDTLYLCGSEFVVSLCPALMQAIGLDIRLNTPLVALLYAALLLIIAQRWLVPLEKRIVAWMLRRYDGALDAALSLRSKVPPLQNGKSIG